MEKPDADGYVNIKWPSKNVPYGGIFHTRTVGPSNNEQFLKVLLEESKFDIELRRNDAFGLRKGREESESAPSVRAPVTYVRPRTSKRRSLSSIRQSGDLEVTNYRPLKRGEDRERLKEKLAHMMQYGDSPRQQPVVQPKNKSKAAQIKLPTLKDKWHDLVTQIRERAEWLAEMEYLGQADPHRDTIKEQIAERMRALDALGIDDVASSARSSKSGFSTIRSREKVKSSPKTPTQNRPESNRSTSTTESKKQKKREVRASQRSAVMEENVGAYSTKLSPLEYSPRRRV